ncbi:HAD family hydrolase [Fusobacterium varium]|uniref:HAD family hydrolase n=1 Tax=Fusobacterium varium TaxID=856 RepID=UPI00242B300F|nr:HAD family hydrolase [Fusobacterium varium]MCI6033333.1 HAD family hydrolase [Fusobacterium varium]
MKLIAMDLDGTLLTKDKRVSDFNRDILNKKSNEGIELVIASGRDLYSIMDLTRCLNVKYHICFNGAKIYKNKKLIYSKSMNKEICLDILEKAVEIGLDYSATAGREVHFTKIDPEYVKEYKTNKELQFFHITDRRPLGREFEKMVFVGEADKFKKLRKYVTEKYGNELNIFGSGDGVMDIVNIQCSKGEALKNVAEDIGIPIGQTMAFGDNENDLSMLDIAGCSVIMANAAEELKKSKYERTVTNDENGVGTFVEKFFR